MRTLDQRGIKQQVEKWAKQSTFYTCEGEEGEFPEEPLSPVPQSPKIEPASDEGAASAPALPLSKKEPTPASREPVKAAPSKVYTTVVKKPEPKKELTEQEKKAAAMRARLAANQRARGKKKKKKKKK